MKLERGKNKKPLKRLSRAVLRKRLVAQEKSQPIVLDQTEYEQWLDHTVLARIQRGEEAIEQVSSLLEQLARERGSTSAKELKLAGVTMEQAVVEFQYAALKHNIMYRPSIGGRTAENVTLWPSSQKRTPPS
jgi:hypothetical protein